MVTKEFKGIVRGEYGRTPVPIDPEFRKRLLVTILLLTVVLLTFLNLNLINSKKNVQNGRNRKKMFSAMLSSDRLPLNSLKTAEMLNLVLTALIQILKSKFIRFNYNLFILEGGLLFAF